MNTEYNSAEYHFGRVMDSVEYAVQNVSEALTELMAAIRREAALYDEADFLGEGKEALVQCIERLYNVEACASLVCSEIIKRRGKDYEKE